MKNQELPADGLALLTKYLHVAPFMVPRTSDGASNVLVHPLLQLENIFVDQETYKITSIVQWQSARVAPFLYQTDVPRFCQHLGPVVEGWNFPQRPETYDSLSEVAKKDG